MYCTVGLGGQVRMHLLVSHSLAPKTWDRHSRMSCDGREIKAAHTVFAKCYIFAQSDIILKWHPMCSIAVLPVTEWQSNTDNAQII